MDFLIGIIVGALLCFAFVEVKKPSGSFTIDLSDSAKDVCTLNLYEDINDIYRKKQIVLKVKTISSNR